MQRKWAGYMAGWLCSALLSAGCSPLETEVARQRAAVLGQSGDHLVSGQEIANQYAVLAADVAAGATVLKVQDLSVLTGVKAGDVLFVIQMQGATIDLLSDSARYGEILNIQNAGHYELVTVAAVDTTAGIIQIHSHGTSGLQFDYSAAGHTQVIAVPQYQNLTVPTGSTLQAQAWNGSTGGVVVVTADTVQVDGAISASGLGFRGGQQPNGVSPANYFGYRTTNAQIAGARGEGVGGGPADYAATGAYGRAAGGNGGGGGNNTNCPGGGGANGLAMGKQWTGQGVMDVSQAGYKTAWMLDPAYDAVNSLFADSAGGGRGGYGCSGITLDPLTTGPSAVGWGCAGRPNLGGLGGRPLLSDVRRRLYFGGGGGAGQANNDNGGSGGNGGGLVFVLARQIVGQGSIKRRRRQRAGVGPYRRHHQRRSGRRRRRRHGGPHGDQQHRRGAGLGQRWGRRQYEPGDQSPRGRRRGRRRRRRLRFDRRPEHGPADCQRGRRRAQLDRRLQHLPDERRHRWRKRCDEPRRRAQPGLPPAGVCGGRPGDAGPRLDQAARQYPGAGLCHVYKPRTRCGQ